MIKDQIAIFWFRRDLRLHDNRGLFEALHSQYQVLPVFIFDTDILDKLEDKKDARVDFILQQLTALNEKLAKYKSGISIYYGSALEVFKILADKYSVAAVFTNEDYEPAARWRDDEVQSFLAKQKISFHSFTDQVIFAKDDIMKDDGTPYSVYTPYARKWLEKWREKPQSPIRSQDALKNLYPLQPEKVSLTDIGFQSTGRKWDIPKLTSKFFKQYAETRNFPSQLTSELSVHLRFGTVGPRELLEKVEGSSETFVKELIWREFFMQLLYHHPHVVTKAFRAEYDQIPWEHDEEKLKCWQEGQTGYPLVDAGMRQLNACGFMHNRVRMVCASFLTKHLLIDWRVGEAYFAAKLLDYDLAANNGNWQWCAGSGADASPYFRIFNPLEQQKKFDPDFKYIKRWVPEYGTAQYPEPLVEHKTARERALAVYKKGLQEK